MKNLHPRIQELKNKFGGELLTCRYVTAPTKSSAKMWKPGGEDDPYKSDPSVIWAYLAVFGIKDTYGTRAIKGCFAKSIQERGPKSAAKNKIIHLFMHDKKEPLGQYLELIEDDYGLRAAIKFDDVEGMPRRIYGQTKSGTINQYSYGFRYVWDKMEYNQTLDCVDMFEADLYEGTSVSVDAANPEACTIRTKEDLTKALSELNEEAEELLATVPRSKQMEVRQIITRYKSLIDPKPLQKVALDLTVKPTNEVAIGAYKIDLTKF